MKMEESCDNDALEICYVDLLKCQLELSIVNTNKVSRRLRKMSG